MDSFSGLLKKAVYLGVGLASYAGEKAGDRLTEMVQEAQQKAEELVRRGEITTEEAKRFVDSILENAIEKVQSSPIQSQQTQSPSPPEPKTIDIVVEDLDS